MKTIAIISQINLLIWLVYVLTKNPILQMILSFGIGTVAGYSLGKLNTNSLD